MRHASTTASPYSLEAQVSSLFSVLSSPTSYAYTKPHDTFSESLSTWWQNDSHFSDPFYSEHTDGYGTASLDRMITAMSSFAPPYPGQAGWSTPFGDSGYYGDLYSSYSGSSSLYPF